MKLDVDIRTGDANAFVRGVFSDQLPAATMWAINGVTRSFQEAERNRMDEIFTLRRRGWARGAVRVRRGDWATKVLPEAKIHLDAAPSGPSRSDDILAKFETDTQKVPFAGGRSIAIPTSWTPRTASGLIPKAWRPKALFQDAVPHGTGKVFAGKTDVLKGEKGTFMIKKAGGYGTIFERIDEHVLSLYQLVPRVKIRPNLQFVETARTTVAQRWGPEFTKAFDRAIDSQTVGRIGPRGGIFTAATGRTF